MADAQLIQSFSEAAANVGARVTTLENVSAAVTYLADNVAGALLFPEFSSAKRLNIAHLLEQAGVETVTDNFRAMAPLASAGLTGANFALADTGTLVLESTAEDIRLASTLPERHFVLLDPEKILAAGREAVPVLRALHQRDPRNYIAYITGPSRTADIERVLTIGVHGPVELHILLVPGLSSDPMEM
ncbi:LutC/YkgG family protein [Trichloromonas sp.]|uniref:LutC/YkgG family protein n=1 Tax=Trichloromonas sp. TaxID=3069249 RepID=UPI003D814A1A